MELVPAAGAEGLARAGMPAAVFKPRHVVVRPLNPCPDLEEPPAPLGALETERGPPPAIKVIDVPEQLPHSGATGFGPPSNTLNHRGKSLPEADCGAC
ncbi:hypothetical protein VULLAG_LOCUS4902 [Vulpes lagopus]